MSVNDLGCDSEYVMLSNFQFGWKQLSLECCLSFQFVTHFFANVSFTIDVECIDELTHPYPTVNHTDKSEFNNRISVHFTTP